MNDVKLELVKNANDQPKREPQWILTIDNDPYPCESASIMSYDNALKFIRMAEAIEGTTDD